MTQDITNESSLLRQASSPTTPAIIARPTISASAWRVWYSTTVKLLPTIAFFSFLTANLAFHSHLALPFSFDGNGRIDPKEIGRQKLLRGNQTHVIDPLQNKQKMKLSLWLIPPGGEDLTDAGDRKSNVYGQTLQVIDELSGRFGGPKFIPHITVVGGIQVDSEKEANDLSKRLSEGLAGFGTVQCDFRDILQEPGCWNQALILEMIPSKTFVELCELSRRLLNMEQEGDCITFPPPAGVPHMSLFYGDSPLDGSDSQTGRDDYLARVFGTDSNGIGDDKKSFQSHRVMLWKTDPSSASGVPEWKPLIDIGLL
ncbi:unnamed protein product [Pseudo-nitzschia multistriata]|uniref:Uncharacterized protein n=1 Tax=Pseudo-nitzschia multistriata TaxID=183589 RepID=A0A448Z9E4_9STRA|nr:unnamed protein product [Pseudo-nitzschia multistriata]